MRDCREITFAQNLEQVKKLARSQGNCISELQIKENFDSLELSDEQLAMIIEYLHNYKIRVGEEADFDDVLSEEEINYLAEYEKELSLIDALSDGEKEALILAAMAGEAQAQQRLITVFLPQVMEISKLYSGQGVFVEDLIGEGNVALTLGVTMLGCLEHAGEAEGMLAKMIMDAMEECITEYVKESEREKKVLARVNKVAEKANELAQDMHRKVTVEELATETGLSEKSIREAIRISGNAIDDLEG